MRTLECYGGSTGQPGGQMSGTYQEVLEYVRRMRGIDFNAYRPETIRRRIEARQRKTGKLDPRSYLLHLRKDPEEVEALIDALTIKVSHFFRNPFVFEVLGAFVLPGLVEACRRGSLRVWCAGCARGEEVYSIAILLCETFEKEACRPDTFIIATDIDREALTDAGKGIYGAGALQEVKTGHLGRYFVKGNGGLYRLKDEVLSMVTLARHDVTSCEPPKEGIFSDYHLILCRNVLIYLNSDRCERVQSFLSGLVKSGGYLVLGEAETMSAGLNRHFAEVISRSKVFRKGGPW